MIKYNYQKLKVFQITKKVFSLLEERAKQKKITLINNADTDISVYADLYMFERVIRNFVNNAIKFTNRYEKIIVFTKKTNDKIIISVEDDGIGMSKETISKLFMIEYSFSTYGTEDEKVPAWV